MKSIPSNPCNDGAEGDERIRTAARALGTTYQYEPRTDSVLRTVAGDRRARCEAERKLVAQREDIERLAERVMAAEARCARLQQALADVREARRRIISACIAVKGKLDQPYPDDDRWTPWTRFVEPALHRLDEALAGLDTPADSQPEDGTA